MKWYDVMHSASPQRNLSGERVDQRLAHVDYEPFHVYKPIYLSEARYPSSAAEKKFIDIYDHSAEVIWKRGLFSLHIATGDMDNG